MHYPSKGRRFNRSIPAGTWRLLIYLGEHDTSFVDRGPQIVSRNTQAVTPVCIGRTHLEEHYIDANMTSLDKLWDGRHVTGDHLQNPGTTEPCITAKATECPEPNVVGMLGLQRLAKRDSEKHFDTA
jgi:hypothetical protein